MRRPRGGDRDEAEQSERGSGAEPEQHALRRGHDRIGPERDRREPQGDRQRGERQCPFSGQIALPGWWRRIAEAGHPALRGRGPHARRRMPRGFGAAPG